MFFLSVAYGIFYFGLVTETVPKPEQEVSTVPLPVCQMPAQVSHKQTIYKHEHDHGDPRCECLQRWKCTYVGVCVKTGNKTTLSVKRRDVCSDYKGRVSIGNLTALGRFRSFVCFDPFTCYQKVLYVLKK